MKSVLFSVSFIILMLFCCNALAQKTPASQVQNSITSSDLREIVKVLTSDSLAGRETGTDGQRKAADYIVEKFKSFGLAPKENGYLEKFKLERRYWGSVYLEVDGSRLENFKDVVYQGAEEVNAVVEKELIFGGNGSDGELNSLNVQDKVVLVFVPNLHNYYDLSVNLKKRKAFGLIIASPTNDKQFETVKTMFRDFQLQKRIMFPGSDTINKKTPAWDSVRLVKTFMIPNSQIKKLMGLNASALSGYITKNNITTVPHKKIMIKCERIRDEIETSNVIGIIRGSSENSIYISAHYDHLGKAAKGYFPGADDNASGTAGILELAEEFSRHKNLTYNLIFMAASGEEQGLLGSNYHVNRPTFDPKKIVADLNLDMIGGVDANHPTNKRYMYAIGVDSASVIETILAKADSLSDKCDLDYSMNLNYPYGIYARSDQFNFYRKGIPSVFFFAGLHRDYHQQTDTMEKIDFVNLESRVRLIAEVIKLLQAHKAD